MKVKRYCPGCGKVDPILLTMKKGGINPDTGWCYPKTNIVKCTGCGIEVRGESANALFIFPELPVLPTADEIALAFQAGWFASLDKDDKQTRFNF